MKPASEFDTGMRLSDEVSGSLHDVYLCQACRREACGFCLGRRSMIGWRALYRRALLDERVALPLAARWRGSVPREPGLSGAQGACADACFFRRGEPVNTDVTRQSACSGCLGMHGSDVLQRCRSVDQPRPKPLPRPAFQPLTAAFGNSGFGHLACSRCPVREAGDYASLRPQI